MITPPSDNNDSEVVIMSEDLFWQVFTDTGDPLCWLMHRAAEKSNNKDGAGDDPRPLG